MVLNSMKRSQRVWNFLKVEFLLGGSEAAWNNFVIYFSRDGHTAPAGRQDGWESRPCSDDCWYSASSQSPLFVEQCVNLLFFFFSEKWTQFLKLKSEILRRPVQYRCKTDLVIAWSRQAICHPGLSLITKTFLLPCPLSLFYKGQCLTDLSQSTKSCTHVASAKGRQSLTAMGVVSFKIFLTVWYQQWIERKTTQQWCGGAKCIVD